MLIETRAILPQNMRNFSFDKDRSRSIIAFILEERLIQKRSLFLKLPLEMNFLSLIEGLHLPKIDLIRTILTQDRSKLACVSGVLYVVPMLNITYKHAATNDMKIN